MDKTCLFVIIPETKENMGNVQAHIVLTIGHLSMYAGIEKSTKLPSSTIMQVPDAKSISRKQWLQVLLGQTNLNGQGDRFKRVIIWKAIKNKLRPSDEQLQTGNPSWVIRQIRGYSKRKVMSQKSADIVQSGGDVNRRYQVEKEGDDYF
ncbi:hypothetical protein EDD21DRAFT_448589 [Dissophora ornata]|nr:hypothetical protein EDD21DRAFT_448589 [Dissophora ornata]